MIFDLATFLEEEGVGRKPIQLQPTQVFYLQGDLADAIFYTWSDKRVLLESGILIGR